MKCDFPRAYEGEEKWNGKNPEKYLFQAMTKDRIELLQLGDRSCRVSSVMCVSTSSWFGISLALGES